MKNTIQNTKLILSCLLLATGMVTAQDKEMSGMDMSKGKGTQMPMEKESGDMSMKDMVGKSKQSCMGTSDTMDIIMKTMQDAMKSDDKDMMKSALQMAENHMMGMKEKMGECSGMMDMMGGMMGKGMMDKGIGGKAKSSTKSKSKAAADTVDHAKHHPAK